MQPDDIGSHINVGRTLKALKRNEEAETVLRTALDLLPKVKKGLMMQSVFSGLWCLNTLVNAVMNRFGRI